MSFAYMLNTYLTCCVECTQQDIIILFNRVNLETYILEEMGPENGSVDSSHCRVVLNYS